MLKISIKTMKLRIQAAAVTRGWRRCEGKATSCSPQKAALCSGVEGGGKKAPLPSRFHKPP